MKIILIILISLNLMAERDPKPLPLDYERCDLERAIYQSNYIDCVNDGFEERDRLLDYIEKYQKEIKDLKRQVRQLKRKSSKK